MDLNGLINMITRIFVRKAINTGINKGLGQMARKGGSGVGKGAPTPADRDQAHHARETAKRARKAARLTRRMGR
jgi:hypothetical protein